MQRQVFKMLVHGAVVYAAVWLAFLLRFDFRIPDSELPHFYLAVMVCVPLKLALFSYFNLYKAWWRLVGATDLATLLAANVTGSAITAFALFEIAGRAFPRSVYVLDFLLCFLVGIGVRVIVRFYCNYIPGSISAKLVRKEVLIYGAGEAGLAMAKEIRRNPALGYRCAGFLDDNADKVGISMLGLPVLGTGKHAATVVRKLREHGVAISHLVVAMPSASPFRLQEVKANCRATGLPFKVVPGLQQVLTGNLSDNPVKDIRLDELLGRDAVHFDETAIYEDVQNASILITGGAGSIGSELCRQIAAFGPRLLIIYDQAESDLFMIDCELRRNFPALTIIPVVGDICDATHLDRVMREYRVEAVYHAAAYKHVPLMETSVLEAVRNNIIGTHKVALAAQRNGVKRFLMISSDKAVNPTSIMGMTKRVSEIILSAMPLDGEPRTTTFVSVRFGNVLGSKGSVIPIFNQQIAAGGPITVTHPDMCRYFMTIPEAVQLVLQASTMGGGSEVFVLDMGEPIKIVDLARNLIRLAGLEPERDIDIQFTGLRPGEKLFEEIQLTGEDICPTFHDRIKIFKTAQLSGALLSNWLTDLHTLLWDGDDVAVIEHLRILVPEYANTNAPAHLNVNVKRMAASAK